jgi:hypothetical protein
MRGRRSWLILKKEDIERLYELEYKLSYLENQGSDLSNDRDYMYYHRLRIEAEELTNDLIPKLRNVFSSWLNFHLRNEGRIQEYRDMPEDVDKLGAQNVKSIIRAYDFLKSISDFSSLGRKFLVINYALHIIHHNGERMVGFGEEEVVHPEYSMKVDDDNEIYRPTYIVDLEESTKEYRDDDTDYFLDRLTEGLEVDRWEKEVNERIACKINWYKIAGGKYG